MEYMPFTKSTETSFLQYTKEKLELLDVMWFKIKITLKFQGGKWFQ